MREEVHNCYQRVVFVKNQKTIKVMSKVSVLSLCVLFLFLGIRGMRSNLTFSGPTQTVSASLPRAPGFDINHLRTNNALTQQRDTVRDTVYVKSEQSSIPMNVTVVAPKRKQIKYRTRTKSYLFIATPRDRAKLSLDSVLADSTISISAMTCLGSKNVKSLARD